MCKFKTKDYKEKKQRITKKNTFFKQLKYFNTWKMAWSDRCNNYRNY